MAISNGRLAMGDPVRLLQSPRQISLFLFIVAVLARLAALGRYVTPDEPIWLFRSLRFREALLAGDWAATIQSGHPGVTVTWLGTIAIQLQLWLQPLSRDHLNWLDQLYWLSPDNGPAFQHLSAFLTAARLGPIILTSLGIAALYWLAQSRFNKTAAFLGLLLLALDPFSAGLSGLLHLDALLATFMMLALLLALPKIDQAGPTITLRQAILSGLFTALSILTKTPGLFLMPFIALLIVWQTVRVSDTAVPISARLRTVAIPLAAWAGTIFIVILILLPASWAAPRTVFETASGLTTRLADSAVRPIFFLGEETLKPGPAFYPLVLAFRLSPVVLIGLVSAAIFAVLKLFKGQLKQLLNSNLLWLLLFSLGFLFFLNLSAKRFDRYALPAVLPLFLISAVGLQIAAQKLQTKNLATFLLPLMVLAQLIYLISFWPYPLTAYNWPLNGPAAAENVFPIGWGEGTSAAAKWLVENQPTATGQTLFTTNVPAAAAFYPGQILPLNPETLSRLKPDDYILFVPQDWQTAEETFEIDPVALAEAKQPPLKTLDFNNLERARLYTGLAPADFQVAAFQRTVLEFRFEDKIAIRAAGALPAAWPNDIQVGIEWQRLQTAETSYFFRLELVDPSGQIWLSQEGPLLNAVAHLVPYWPDGQSQEVFYTFSPSSYFAPGQYSVHVTLFDEQGARMGIFDDDGRFAGVTAPLASLTIPAPTVQLPLEIPNARSDGTELAGFNHLPERIGTGETLKFDLWWRQLPQTVPSGQLSLSFNAIAAPSPLTTTGWVPGQKYQLRPAFRVPADLESGQYTLSLQWLDENGRPLWPEAAILGDIEITARSRSFELPDTIDPLQIQLGTVALLQQAAVEVTAETITIDVTWQAVEPDGVFYTTFLHLLDQSGSTVSQGDRPPLEPTHTWVAGQVVQEQYQLPRPADGRYIITIGLYDQTNGLRLPIYTADGSQLPDDQYLIEVTLP